MSSEPLSRAALRRARRVCIKAGTSVVANLDGQPSLTRLSALCEQVAELINDPVDPVQVILVSSGAVGMGKKLLRRRQQTQNQDQKQQEDILSPITNDDDDALLNLLGMGKSSSEAAKYKRSYSLLELNKRSGMPTPQERKLHYDSACAAAGQFELMNLYNTLFQQCDVTASQILVTHQDFDDPDRLSNLTYAVDRLLRNGVVPILNENDAVSANMGYTDESVFSDNDGLASLVARSLDCQVLMLLTDVAGVYDRPPTEAGARLLSVYNVSDGANKSTVSIGAKSAQGRGGMAGKIDAATAAVQPGATTYACVVAPGLELDTIRNVLGRSNDDSNNSEDRTKPRGTLFCRPGSELEQQAIRELEQQQQRPSKSGAAAPPSAEAREKALAARSAARTLQALPFSVRQDMLRGMADALLDESTQATILAANRADVEQAAADGLDRALQARLKLTPEKLGVLASGLRQLANLPDCLGVVKAKRELSPGIVLSQVTVPIGVLLIIFESRPDSLPQIAALAIASGNGLLLKGGKEAARSNAALHSALGDAIEMSSSGRVSRHILGLVPDRGQVADLLAMDDTIDLVIPRGSNALVAHIKANTRIPVLGHADGVCHVYVHPTASAEIAAKIAVDSKCDYPAACNAMETLLLHKDTLESGVAHATLTALTDAGVTLLGGPRYMELLLTPQSIKLVPVNGPAPEPKHEYGDLTCQVEVVENLDAAVDWIHAHGSGHTEAIVCGKNDGDGDDNSVVAETFLRRVDAACVFSNCSTRFADGYRFGLGAEVGIATGRIHARGPVGMEGLVTTKWQLRGGKVSEEEDGACHLVKEFAGGASAKKKFTHQELPTC